MPRQPNGENHCWLVWDFRARPASAGVLFADPNAESEPEARGCIVCRKPLPLTARADARLCSADMPEARQPPGRGPAPHGVTGKLMLTATLTRPGTITAADITLTSREPTLALCRALIDAGLPTSRGCI